MDKPLSFSAYKEYHECPRKYKLNRIDKVPQGKETSALVVGSIVDTVVETILKGGCETPNATMLAEIVNGKTKDITFYDNDLDWDLVDLPSIENFAKELGWQGDDIKEAIKTFLKDQDNLSENQLKLLRFACWSSLEVVIPAMIASFEKWILPQIVEVHEVQHHISDDKTHGYLDFTATIKDGRKVLFDLKTTKVPYAQDAVLKSPQLSLYAALHDYEYAGFITLCKTLNKNKIKTCPSCNHNETGGNRKNCPSCSTTMEVVMNPTSYSQILVDAVPEWNKELTKNAMCETIKLIDTGIFPRNLNTCFYLYGKTCPYIKQCWEKK